MPTTDSATIGRISRFALVGIAATLTHAAILWALVSVAGLRPSMATLAAFCVAFGVSYLGHYKFTFRSTQPHGAALPAFAFAALTGAFLNFIIFVVMTDVFRASYWQAFAVTIVCVPPVVYILSKSLAFSPAERLGPKGEFRNWIIPFTLLAFTAVYTMVFHFQAPYFDHWDIVPFYEAAQSGTLKPADLFAQHGSHWHATGYVIMLATADITGMAHWVDPLINLILAAFGFVALTNIIRRALIDFDAVRYLPIALALAAFVHFSPDQAANWLWGWQVALFASMAGVLWCIDLLSRPGLTLPRLTVAACAAILAVYGFATAWALLPIGLALILLCPDTNLRVKLISGAVWMGVFAALFYHFLVTDTGYAATVVHNRALLESVIGIAHYVGNFLGSAVARISRPGALIIAAVSSLGFLALLGIIIARGWKAVIAARALLSLIAFALGAGILTALGRWAEFGPEQAFANRYITLSNNAWLGLVILGLCLSARWTGKLKLLAIAALCAFGAAKTLNNASAINTALLARQINAHAASLACTYPHVPQDTRSLISSDTQKIDEHLAILHSRQASLFRPEAMRHCSVPEADMP